MPASKQPPAKKNAPTKSARSSSSSSRKKPRPKNNAKGFHSALITAFLAGLFVATLFFWNMYVSQKKHAEATPQAIAAKNAGTKSRGQQALSTNSSQLTPSLLPPINKDGSPKPGSQNSPNTPSTTTSVKPKVSLEPSQAGSASKASGDPTPAGAPSAAPLEVPQVSKALAEGSQRIPTTVERLPYEEGLKISLDDRIRQIDYALMQAAWAQKLPPGSVRVAVVENRLEGIEPYHFQTVDIVPGPSDKAFLKALRESLQAWATTARLTRVNNDRWVISLNNLETHTLRLHPEKKEFADAHPQSAASLRRREPGEPARLVIVIDDLGANMGAIHQLLALKFPVTFAFWPHAFYTRDGAEAAHRAGQEIIIHQPMEPMGYPQVQPGPGVLLAGASRERIQAILAENIPKVPHAVGLNNHMGSRFTQSSEGVQAVLEVLEERGLFMLDSLTHPRSIFYKEAQRYNLKTYQRQVFLDVEATRSNVLYQLKQAERIALLTGEAIAIGHPLPATLAGLAEWQSTRDVTVQIVPLRNLHHE